MSDLEAICPHDGLPCEVNCKTAKKLRRWITTRANPRPPTQGQCNYIMRVFRGIGENAKRTGQYPCGRGF